MSLMRSSAAVVGSDMGELTGYFDGAGGPCFVHVCDFGCDERTGTKRAARQDKDSPAGTSVYSCPQKTGGMMIADSVAEDGIGIEIRGAD